MELDNLPTKLANERRPHTFSAFVGQGNSKGGPVDFLKMAVAKDKHPGVIFITGPSGGGKTSLAKLYTRATLCPNRQVGEYEPCGTCEICMGLNIDNICEYTIKEATEFRESIPAIIELIYASPHATSTRKDQFRRFIIIDEAQNASRQAISALLDPLEFGPDTTTIILVSMDPDKLDPIVRDAIESRSIPLHLNRLSSEQIAEALVAGIGIEYPDALHLAFFCDGNMRLAWSYVEYFSILGEPITESSVYEKLAGGATQGSRNKMWGAMLAGDIDTLVWAFHAWNEAGGNEILLANILLRDALYFDYGELPIGELCSLIGSWLKTVHKPPLVTVLIVLAHMMKKDADIHSKLDGIINPVAAKTLKVPEPFLYRTWDSLRRAFK